MEAQLQATADPIHRRPLAALSRVEGEDEEGFLVL